MRSTLQWSLSLPQLLPILSVVVSVRTQGFHSYLQSPLLVNGSPKIEF